MSATASRPGRKPPLSAAAIARVVNTTLNEKPPAGTHWSARKLAKAIFAFSAASIFRLVFFIIRSIYHDRADLAPIKQPVPKSGSTSPHLTEDTPIDPASIKTSNEVFSDWVGASAPHVAADLNTGFGGYLQWNSEWDGVRQGVHTLPRLRCGSLVAVRVPRLNLSFSEAFGKLKATLNDGVNSYQLTVSSKVLKEAWRAGGLAAVNNVLPARQDFQIRVGLARPFQNPPKCYAMLNGVL